ncbi:MAG TPA: Gfo/Idh/MocA family oxidoreductase [Bacteroidales bacterium]|jgi:predicted dehydrogenase|nr:Gfo/Idh/MocA family oxidoreductase [Bacteroidales bacterium]HQH23977.1 Gfo/Idh/MocA family oxidoreductase [Bacteroidales bacterium]HQJ81307.1 Gfo/Idh/MocA family oxidoreductase [Bacteroidales bacterium]
MQSSRRKFLRKSLASAAGLAAINAFPEGLPFGNLHTTSYPEEIILRPATVRTPGESIRFSVIGLNHDHIYGMSDALIRGGGKLVSVYAPEPELLKTFTKRFPGVRIAGSEKEILEDTSVQLVASASIPVDRAPLGIRVMKSGKDFMADKPGIVTPRQLEEVKKVQKITGRIYSIMYSERLGNPASVQAGNLIEAGAIGKVVQTIGLGPHRMRPASRPDWFFDPEKAGGILCDIGSHQCDQFLFYTGSKQAEVSFAQTGNFANGKYPAFQDFGDMSVRSPHASGYIRIDWFTPDGLNTWGDGRTFILGTEGYIEMRKYIDIAGREGGNHLFLVNNRETKYYNCSGVHMPYGEQIVSDVVNRTETAMSQDHCFLASELAIRAQEMAFRLTV